MDSGPDKCVTNVSKHATSQHSTPQLRLLQKMITEDGRLSDAVLNKVIIVSQVIQIEMSHGSCPMRFEQPTKFSGFSGCASCSHLIV